MIIQGNNLIVDNDEYIGTPGLWELIIAKEPDKKIYTPEDKKVYEELVLKTNVLHRNDDPTNPKPRGSNSNKWKDILSPLWWKSKGFSEKDAELMSKNKNYRNELLMKMKKGEYKGSGVIVISSDPNALIERLDLLLASKNAGHVENELVSIYDELKRQGVRGSETYKNLNSYIKK